MTGSGDHLVLDVDRLAKADGDGSGPSAAVISAASPPSDGDAAGKMVIAIPKEEEEEEEEEGEPLLLAAECRICQEEDSVKNLENPCACTGSLKFAHKTCLQRWINEKGDLTCEICHQPYKSGYVAPPRIQLDETTIDLGGGWTISGTPLDLRDPRILAVAAAQHRFLEAEYDEYATRNTSAAAFCRSIALILMALLLLRHAMTITNGEESEDASASFSLFLLRAAGFLLPCYIMAWAISILHQRRQRQEAAAALAASEVSVILQSGEARGLQFTIAPESPATPHRETPQHEPLQQTV